MSGKLNVRVTYEGSYYVISLYVFSLYVLRSLCASLYVLLTCTHSGTASRGSKSSSRSKWSAASSNEDRE